MTIRTPVISGALWVSSEESEVTPAQACKGRAGLTCNLPKGRRVVDARSDDGFGGVADLRVVVPWELA